MRFPNEVERLKRAKLIELLEEGLVSLWVHPGVEGVVLPEHLRAQPVVRLHLSRTFNLSVLEIGPLAVRADLSFQGQRSLCVLPWAAIVGLISEVSEAQYLFPLHDEPDQATAPPVTPSPQPQRRPHLKVIT